MLEQHGRHGNALTVFCTRDPEIGGLRRESLLRPAGVYCCDPAVLGLINAVGYQDLKEQLIPALLKAGLRVGAVTLEGSTCEVADWQTYLQVLHQVISAGSFETDGYEEVAPGVWLGEDVDVAPEARIVGPAILGRGCRIDDNSVVIGPAILGNDCQVANRAWLIRVVAADFTCVMPGAAFNDRFMPSREDHTRAGARRSTRPGAKVLPRRRRSSEGLVPGLTLLGASVWGWGSAAT
jgi:NDP-sugar pyrophosphorylase family protein